MDSNFEFNCVDPPKFTYYILFVVVAAAAAAAILIISQY